MNRPEPSYPKRSPEGAARHAKKKYVRTAYMDPMPKSKRDQGRRSR